MHSAARVTDKDGYSERESKESSMKMIFSHTDISFVHYLQKLLEERGIQSLVKNDNIAIDGDNFSILGKG